MTAKGIFAVLGGLALLVCLLTMALSGGAANEERQPSPGDYAGTEKAQLRDAQLHVSSLFRKANPHATIQWATYEMGFLPDKAAILVRFQYSVKNAFGGTAVHQKTVKVSSDLTQVLAEDDDFLHYQ